uniref:Uncharacterized protein n=1 Tax=Anguilla anguilla TaxID=7936 RepID=A0A0E9RTG4_ANGAN
MTTSYIDKGTICSGRQSTWYQKRVESRRVEPS